MTVTKRTNGSFILISENRLKFG